MKRLIPFLVLLPVLLGCGRQESARPPGAVYQDISHPRVWKVVPFSQAESLGLVTGDLVIAYDGKPVSTNDEIRNAQAMALGSREPIPVVLLRRNQEVVVGARPGPLGVMPVSARHPSSLALALQDAMTQFGMFTDYDWLAALTGESFTFTARADVCRAWWPGGKARVYLDEVARAAGLKLERVRGTDDPAAATDAIRGELLRGRVVLVEGGWPDYRRDFWGIARRFDQESGRVYGLTMDASAEQPLVGPVQGAWVVSRAGDWVEPEKLVRQVLVQALELAQVRSGEGWLSGIEAWDQLIVSLESIPFCPVCGELGSQDCLDRLVWATVAHKESANRFLEWMRLALPDQAPVIDDLIAGNSAIIGKLEGLARSGTKLGRLADQQKIARLFGDVQLIEAEQVGRYEELIGAL
ncbi:hypothetical protein JXB37_07485 [candidate division WOR-3 bacterium]|nr:hypothetical protein [candidate division WOR-3 bacterium]